MMDGRKQPELTCQTLAEDRRIKTGDKRARRLQCEGRQSGPAAVIVRCRPTLLRSQNETERGALETSMAAHWGQNNAKRDPHEQLDRGIAAPRATSVETGNVTPAMKVQRTQIKGVYAEMRETWLGLGFGGLKGAVDAPRRHGAPDDTRLADADTARPCVKSVAGQGSSSACCGTAYAPGLVRHAAWLGFFNPPTVGGGSQFARGIAV
jgi:hypothetical protein